MNKLNFREKVMLSCLLVLILFFISIFVRLGTKSILIEKLHLDNALTQIIFLDNVELSRAGVDSNQTSNVETVPPPSQEIDWAAAYPFEETPQNMQVQSQENSLWQQAEAFQAKILNFEATKIGDLCTKNLIFYQQLVTAGRNIEHHLGWNVTNPTTLVYKMSDGYLTLLDSKQNQDERVSSVVSLAEYVESQGSKFLFILSPSKANPFGDRELKGVDYSNDNGDRLLQGLRERNVSVYDLRPDLHEYVGNTGWHQAFFRTDHHWTPATAMWAAGMVLKKLKDDYSVDVNNTHFSIDDYNAVVYENYFLGSQGKRVTLVNTTPDDFTLYYPKFKTNIHIEIPKCGINDDGDFSIFYNMYELGKGDFYKENPYAVYGYGDQPEIVVHNYENENLQDKKILLIKDSFMDSAMPFLMMGLKDLRVLDLRLFKGSVKKYIKEHKPDIVLVMYIPFYAETINWNSHGDLFDFR